VHSNDKAAVVDRVCPALCACADGVQFCLDWILLPLNAKVLSNDMWDRCWMVPPVREMWGLLLVSCWGHWWCHRWQAGATKTKGSNESLLCHCNVPSVHAYACLLPLPGGTTYVYVDLIGTPLGLGEQYLWSLCACRECMPDTQYVTYVLYQFINLGEIVYI
jgi:hypothetical protein